MSVRKGDTVIAITAEDTSVTSEYISEQFYLNRDNKFSNYFTAFNTPVEMPYDGVISMTIPSTSLDYAIIINNNRHALNNDRTTGCSFTAFFTKGDSISISWNTDNTRPAFPTNAIASIHFYDQRDYSFRV